MARMGEEFPLACPTCGGDIRLIAFKLFYQCETIPGLRTVGNLRLLRTSCPRSSARPPTGANSSRPMTNATRFNRRIDDVPVIDIIPDPREMSPEEFRGVRNLIEKKVLALLSFLDGSH
jgi:hypothetical protein